MRLWKNEKMTMITGDAKEISRLYRKLGKRENIFPEFCNPPKFNMEKRYGVLLTYYDEFRDVSCEDQPRLCVVSADTALHVLEEEF